MSLNESVFRAEQAIYRTPVTVAMRTPMSLIAAVLLAISAPLAAGCVADADLTQTSEVVFPLTQAGSQGELYHLTNATFDISGADGVTTVDGGGNQNQVSVDLAPGLFSVSLRDGWVLEKSTDGGARFAPVSALLGSANPHAFRVLANQPLLVNFDFLIRNINGTLMIRLGVIPDPRELAGGMVVDSATDGLAAYAQPENRNLDFAIYYTLSAFESQSLTDGTKQHVYSAGAFGVLGPNEPIDSPVATEFYNDNLGTLSVLMGKDLTGGFLQYTVAAKPDGKVELSGFVFGGQTELDFDPSPIDATIPAIGSDGFPNDEFFYDSGVPFTLTSPQGMMTGRLRMRHIVP